MAEENAKNSSGYGDYDVYCTDHADTPDTATFARYNRIASCMVDFLCGRGVRGDTRCVREAVHWQIRHMREKGSVEACFSGTVTRESFAGYTVARQANGGIPRLFGMELSPVALSILRAGGVLSYWV